MADELETLRSLIEKALRRGETQTSLARAIGASQPQISKIRNGVSSSNSRVARALFEHLRLARSDRRQSEVEAAVSALARAAGSDHKIVVTIVRELAKFVRSTRLAAVRRTCDVCNDMIGPPYPVADSEAKLTERSNEDLAIRMLWEESIPPIHTLHRARG